MTVAEAHPPVSWAVVERFVDVVWACTLAGAPHPDIHSHAAGGVRLEWPTDGASAEIDILNDGRSVWRSGAWTHGSEPVERDLVDADPTDVVSMVIEYRRSSAG